VSIKGSVQNYVRAGRVCADNTTHYTVHCEWQVRVSPGTTLCVCGAMYGFLNCARNATYATQALV